MGDYLTVDSKIFRSVKALLFKPGFLTNEYLAGRRARYVSPLRLYLVATFLFFFIVTINSKIPTEMNRIADGQSGTVNKDSLINQIEKHGGDSIPASARDKMRNAIDSSFKYPPEKQEIEPGIPSSSESKDKISQLIRRKADYLSSLGEKGKRLLWREILNLIPKILFLLLPVFALSLKLLYIRKKAFYVEHLIYALHFHAFIFLILIPAVLFPGTYSGIAAAFSIFLYFLISLHNVYRQSYLISFIKIAVLTGLAVLLVLPTLIILLVLAVISV